MEVHLYFLFLTIIILGNIKPSTEICGILSPICNHNFYGTMFTTIERYLEFMAAQMLVFESVGDLMWHKVFGYATMVPLLSPYSIAILSANNLYP